MTTHCMIDLESLATSHDAHILSIGLVSFDPVAGKIFAGKTLGCGDAPQGRAISEKTLAWWREQSEEARLASLQCDMPLNEALQQVIAFCQTHQPEYVWANGPTFDIEIMQHAFAQHGLEWPFPYWAERCVRTARDMAALKPNFEIPKFQGVAHQAQADAEYQAQLVIAAYRHLGLARDAGQ